jgi:hypothetical protein
MNENLNPEFDSDNYEERRRLRQKRRKRQTRMRYLTIFIVFILAVAVAFFVASQTILRGQISLSSLTGLLSSRSGGQSTVQVETSAPAQTEAAPVTETSATETPVTETAVTEIPAVSHSSVLEEARLLAAGYDYDGAIELLQAVPEYASDSEITDAIREFEETKASCVAVDVTTVPHIFYHSLLNDTDRAFDVSVLGQSAVDGMNAWMVTVEEFDKITQTMYENGYVIVRLRDLVVETTDEDGNVTFTPNTNLLLPPGKKAVVLSVDDLAYYHSYEDAGFPDKLVLDENGDVKCHYVTSDGEEHIGDYDVVPRLNTFLAEHPDGAYKGARGMIALTGYNGVFGYRTDSDYELQQNLMADQAKWLEEHPDFDRQTEIAEATKIAEALKEEGWEFASHTWGHLSVTGKTVDELRTDNEKWVNNVQNIVGTVDTIIFAHGNDIGEWTGYSDDNEKYAYYKSVGYNFYCNVDSSQPYWVQITSDYVRQGRINIDGYRLYQSSIGNTTVLDNLFLASQVFDERRPTPVVANGES